MPIFELHPHFLIVARCREWSKIFGDNEVIIVAAAFVVIAKRENLREDNLKKKKDNFMNDLIFPSIFNFECKFATQGSFEFLFKALKIYQV